MKAADRAEVAEHAAGDASQAMNPKEIVLGRRDSTVTVFVPWDCGNNCSFCTTKNEYRGKYGSESLDEQMGKVCRSLKAVAESGNVENVVFTGGEPFADLERLARLVEAVPHGKKCYVNTSLHVKNLKRVATRLESRLWDGLDGISLSCHICKGGFFDKGILDVARAIGETRKVRINSLVDGDEPPEVICAFCDTVLGDGGFEYMNFRGDYRNTTQNTLGSADDGFFRTLMSIPEWKYKGFSGCLVCRTDSFKTPFGKVYYHRGVEKTSLRFGDKLVINDFVIKQDGEIRYDWDEDSVMSEGMLEALGVNGV